MRGHLYHHDYSKRCAARGGCIHSRRNLVLVGTPDRTGQHGANIDAWDGYHWLVARQLAQDQDWVSLKHYMDTMGETHLRETIEGLIQSESPRLYREYWTACPVADNDDDDSAPPPDDPAFAKTDAGS